MAAYKKEGHSNVIWGFFSSIKLTIVLLIILAIVSILGTIIPQRGQGAVEFARGLSPELLRFLSSLNLFDMYHSLWFRLLVGCLAINLIICSIDRFSGAWKRFSTIPRADRNKPFEHLPPHQIFSIRGDAKNAADTVGQFLNARYKKIQTKEALDQNFFYGEKGRYSHFGAYLVHLSVLIILIGGMVGSFFGFEAYVNIAEGEQTGTVTLRKSMKPLNLGFEVRCDRFMVDFYENGAPKEYISDLRFFVDGKGVKKGSALVNHPVQFKGMMFYQASYGTLPGKKVWLKMSRHSSDKGTKTLEVETGHIMQLPGNEGRFQVLKVNGNLKGTMGPAALVSVKPHLGEETRFWIFQNPEMLKKRFPEAMLRSPRLNASAFKPYTFFLDRTESRYYTGLQVNKDPGVNIVWIGCFLMVTGFFVTFFTSHRKIWVRVTGKEQGTEISVSGTASKNPVGLERELRNLTQNLKQLLTSKG